MSFDLEAERVRVIQLALHNLRPCMVCSNRQVVVVGSWIPDKRSLFAAGGTEDLTPVFAFWLCATHCEPTQENDKAVRQAVIRCVRSGGKNQV